MKFAPILVVNPPLANQGSVLGRIVAGDTRLGEILRLVFFCIAIEQSHAETLAEIAALRKSRASDPPIRLETVYGETSLKRPDEVATGRCGYWRTTVEYRPNLITQSRHRLKDQGAYLPNWCPTCKQYVAWSHDGPNGIRCEQYLKQQSQQEAKRIAKHRLTSEPRLVLRIPAKSLKAWKNAFIHKNCVEGAMIARLDTQKYRETEQREKSRRSLHLAAKQAEMRVRAKVRARGKVRRRKTVR